MKERLKEVLDRCANGVNDGFSADQVNHLLAECHYMISGLLDALREERGKPKERGDRTERQSSSRWLYLDSIARQMNDMGIDRSTLVKQISEHPRVEAQNTKETLYYDYWLPVHKALYPNAVRLNTEQIQKVYDAMNNHAAREFGVSAPWPDRFN